VTAGLSANPAKNYAVAWGSIIATLMMPDMLHVEDPILPQAELSNRW
jgi:hypothetical protein